jgi:cytoskeletal protein CcmA (bactofilin family)
MKRPNFEPPEPYGTYLGPAVTMSGRLRSSLPLNVRCVFRGTLEGTFIRIDRNADVQTTACTAQQAVIAGHFTGAMSVVDSIVILPHATVAADIRAADIQIIEGATFEGSIETYERDERH